MLILLEERLMQLLMDSTYMSCSWYVVAIELLGMLFDTFRAHHAKAAAFGAEVSDGLLPVPVTRDVVVEVGLHVLEGKPLGDLHGG